MPYVLKFSHNKEKLVRYEEQQRRSDERVKRNAASIRQSKETIGKTDVFAKTLDILERQIRNNLFTESEMLEIMREKDYINELTLRAIETTEYETELTKI